MFGVLLSCKIFYGISFKVAITNDMSIKKVYIIVGMGDVLIEHHLYNK